MASIDLGSTLSTLKSERIRLQHDLAKLEKAIETLEQLGSNGTSSNGHAKRHLSAAARERIAKAQRLRWAKVRQQKGSKS